MKEQISDSDFNPEEDKLKFQEQPELEGQVKERIAEIMQGRTSRPVIITQDAIRYLRGKFGIKFTSLICNVTEKDLSAFARNNKPKIPTPLQNRNIAAAYMIADILLSSVPDSIAADWFTSWDNYLFGIPSEELSRRPEDVRIAALNFISQGR